MYGLDLHKPGLATSPVSSWRNLQSYRISAAQIMLRRRPAGLKKSSVNGSHRADRGDIVTLIGGPGSNTAFSRGYLGRWRCVRQHF